MFRSQLRASALIVGSFLAACDGDITSSLDTGPVAARVAVSPDPGAMNVARSGAIELWFDSPVDSASCATRFTLHMGDESGQVVPGRMRWDDGYRHMRFQPDSVMAAGTHYTAHLRDSIMTRNGVMSGGMMGGGMMGGTHRGQHLMPGRPMMFEQPPRGAARLPDGMMWSFTTGA